MAQIHHIRITLLLGISTIILALGSRTGKLGEKGRIGAGRGQRLSAKGLISLKKRAYLG